MNSEKLLENSIELLYSFIKKKAPLFLIVKQAEVVIYRYYTSWFKFFLHLIIHWFKNLDMHFLMLYLYTLDFIGITEIRNDNGIPMRHKKNCKNTHFTENICDDPDDYTEYEKRTDKCLEETYPSYFIKKLLKKE